MASKSSTSESSSSSTTRTSARASAPKYWNQVVSDEKTAEQICRNAANAQLGLMSAQGCDGAVYIMFKSGAPVVTRVQQVVGDPNRPDPPAGTPDAEMPAPTGTQVANAHAKAGYTLVAYVPTARNKGLMFFSPDGDLARALEEPSIDERRKAKRTEAPPPPPPAPTPTQYPTPPTGEAEGAASRSET